MTTVSPSLHPSLDVLPYRALLRSSDLATRKALVMALYASDRPEAESVLRQALHDPDEPIRLLAAQALERLSQSFQKAVQAQRRDIERRPDDPHLQIQLARRLFESNGRRAELEEAARWVNAARPRLAGDDRSQADLLLGRIELALGEHAAARDSFDAVPAEARDYPLARLLWSESQWAAGHLDTARAEMQRIARLFPDTDAGRAAQFWEKPA